MIPFLFFNIGAFCRTYDSVYASNGDERSIIGTQRWPCTLTRVYIHTCNSLACGTYL